MADSISYRTWTGNCSVAHAANSRSQQSMLASSVGPWLGQATDSSSCVCATCCCCISEGWSVSLLAPVRCGCPGGGAGLGPGCGACCCPLLLLLACPPMV